MIIEIPKFICRFENYTQSVEFIQIMIYIFAIIGLLVGCWGVVRFLYWLLIKLGGGEC